VPDDSPPTGDADIPFQSVRFVGPATAAVLERSSYDVTAITDKTVSYRLLVDAGVNPGVAAKIRREHSLSWSFNSGGDLDRRSTQIRGLGTEEAEWIAASAGDWEESHIESTASSSTDDEPATEPPPWPTHGEPTATKTTETAAAAVDTATDGSGGAITAEAAWRARSKPTPVGELTGVDDVAVDRLAEAGITSVRSLATANPERVADALEFSRNTVEEWYQTAQEEYGDSPSVDSE